MTGPTGQPYGFSTLRLLSRFGCCSDEVSTALLKVGPVTPLPAVLIGNQMVCLVLSSLDGYCALAIFSEIPPLYQLDGPARFLLHR
jgi:hypothetical protein